MFKEINIEEQLKKLRIKTRKQEDLLLSQAKQILDNDLFSEKKVLQNLKQYKQKYDVIDEEFVDSDLVFTPQEIKNISVIYRLKFLESKYYKLDFPYEAIVKVKELDKYHGKELKTFRVLACPPAFLEKDFQSERSLFVKTNHNNYYLVHRWGEPLKWYRKIKFLPFRTFESLALTLITFTLILTLVLPTELITLDSKATYWSGYRGGTFFHLLFFNFGFTAYFLFAFSVNLSSSVWNKLRDFG
jgi:hypothetical protein